jgi:hypothetical protein
MGKNYWMVVESLENFEITKGLGFTLHGLGSRYRRRAQRMQPDDRVLYYVKTIRKWAATATITSRCFEDNTPIWKPTTRGERFTYRVKLAPDVVLDEDDYVDALFLAPSLDYLKRWLPEVWPLAFYDRLHLLPQRDFRLIEGEMKRNLSKRRRAARSRRSRARSWQPAGSPAETDGQSSAQLVQPEAGGQRPNGDGAEPESAQVVATPDLERHDGDRPPADANPEG